MTSFYLPTPAGVIYRLALDDISAMLTSPTPRTVEEFCADHRICRRFGHWTDYCTEACTEEIPTDG